MRKTRMLINIILLFLAINTFAKDPALQERTPVQQDEINKNLPSLHVDVFGESQGEGIDSGFVFIDGRYISPPYHVSRHGLGIFINGHLTEKPLHWFTNTTDVAREPKLPESITRQSSFADIQEYVSAKHRALAADKSGNILVNEMINDLRTIPCVQDVVKLDDFRVKVVLFSGETQIMNMRPFSKGPKLPQDITSVRQRAEEQRSQLENKLKTGECYFFFSSGGTVSSSTGGRLPALVDILNSTNDPAVKIEQLKNAGFKYLTLDGFSCIVTNFSESTNLNARLESLFGQNHAVK